MDLDAYWDRFDVLDQRITSFLAEEGVILLRYAVAIIFIWFGALKPLGISPAAELVANTVFWFDPAWFVPVLGYWEILIGVCFLYKPLVRVGIALLAPQMMGTFLPLLLLPDVAFTQFPYGLTMEGQYIIKNLVIIGAAMVIGGTVRD